MRIGETVKKLSDEQKYELNDIGASQFTYDAFGVHSGKGYTRDGNYKEKKKNIHLLLRFVPELVKPSKGNTLATPENADYLEQFGKMFDSYTDRERIANDYMNLT